MPRILTTLVVALVAMLFSHVLPAKAGQLGTPMELAFRPNPEESNVPPGLRGFIPYNGDGEDFERICPFTFFNYAHLWTDGVTSRASKTCSYAGIEDGQPVLVVYIYWATDGFPYIRREYASISLPSELNQLIDARYSGIVPNWPFVGSNMPPKVGDYTVLITSEAMRLAVCHGMKYFVLEAEWTRLDGVGASSAICYTLPNPDEPKNAKVLAYLAEDGTWWTTSDWEDFADKPLHPGT